MDGLQPGRETEDYRGVKLLLITAGSGAAGLRDNGSNSPLFNWTRPLCFGHLRHIWLLVNWPLVCNYFYTFLDFLEPI